METKTYTTIDRTGWSSGEWDGGPDKMQWADPATGMPCLAVRNLHMGVWCGYVGVTPDHPLHGKGYEDIEVAVHWGLSYSDECRPADDESTGICHVPGEGEPDRVWWFGFDCGHGGDLAPNPIYNPRFSCKYRPLSFVQQECTQLAAQLWQIREIRPPV